MVKKLFGLRYHLSLFNLRLWSAKGRAVGRSADTIYRHARLLKSREDLNEQHHQNPTSVVRRSPRWQPPLPSLGRSAFQHYGAACWQRGLQVQAPSPWAQKRDLYGRRFHLRSRRRTSAPRCTCSARTTSLTATARCATTPKMKIKVPKDAHTRSSAMRPRHIPRAAPRARTNSMATPYDLKKAKGEGKVDSFVSVLTAKFKNSRGKRTTAR